ncbi:SDR family oxidoreductase [Microbacterium oxydans]|uniref:SDR family oxidoreductase n=1 Tax=Microbacterium oxydans TaxID=82380 RepID=UPI001FC9A7C4|nr:SDR family oxidoreductase [Microbacterium oxydans]
MLETFGINGSVYICGCSAAVSAIIDQGLSGAIVTIGSIRGRASFTDHTAYDFAKTDIDALARRVAMTYGVLGMRPDIVAPAGAHSASGGADCPSG